MDFFAVVDVAIPIDDLKHLGSRITLKLTKVLVHVLSVRKSTLQGESNRLYGYEARCSVDNDDVEIRVVSTVYTLSMGLFWGEMVDNSNMPHPKCLGSQKNPGTEPKTCEKGPKLGFEYLPTSKTLHCVRTACVRTACMAFPGSQECVKPFTGTA